MSAAERKEYMRETLIALYLRWLEDLSRAVVPDGVLL